MKIVRTFATSANLGPGFDCLGICFDLYNEYEFFLSDKYTIEGFSEKFSNPSDNLIVKSYEKVFLLKNKKIQFLTIRQKIQNIPVSRGLGSSASCIVAGIIMANEILGGILSKDEIFQIASMIEGHPDNVLPALVGGLCAAFMAHEKYYYKKYIPSSRLQFYSLIPPFELKTELSRSVLPKMYNRCDVIANLSRIVNLPSAFIDGDIELLKAIFDDKIHEPYRYKLIEHSLDVKTYFKDYAVAISGAGSSLLVIGDKVIELDKIYDFKIVKVIVDNNGVEIYEC